MKIIVSQSALERLQIAIGRYQETGKTVERVVVTRGEYEALLGCPFGPSHDDPAGQRSCLRDGEMFVMGVPVVVAFPEPSDMVAEDVPVGVTA